MKILFTIIIFITFFSTGFAQNALLPAYPREISHRGDIAYFNGSPFTGLLVDEKTNKKIGEYKNGYKNGIFKEYYASGKEKSELKYKNGNVVDGKYITYLKNGQKETEITYKDGSIILSGKYEDGKFIVFLELSVEVYPNGFKKSEGYLKNGKRNGLWTFFYELGRIKSQGNYKDGIEDSQWVTFFKDRKIEYEGSYKNGMKDGQGIYHNYKGRNTYDGEWKNDKWDGYGTITWDDGFINYQGEFKNGKPDGLGTTFEKGKKVYDGVWTNGKKNGKGSYDYKDNEGNIWNYKGYFINDTFRKGTLTLKLIDGSISIMTGEFKNWGLFNGINYMTVPNGNKSVTEFKDGIQGRTKIISGFK